MGEKGGGVGVVELAVVLVGVKEEVPAVDKEEGAVGVLLSLLRSRSCPFRYPRLKERTSDCDLEPKGCGRMRVMVEDQFCRPLGCLRVSSFCCETRNRKSDLSMMECVGFGVLVWI